MSPDLDPADNVWSFVAHGARKNGKQHDALKDLKMGINAAHMSLKKMSMENLVRDMKKTVFTSN